VALVRETIYAALFTRLQAIPGLVTVSRRLQHVNDVPPSAQPALFLAQTRQLADYVTGRTTFWHLHAAIYIYARDPAGQNPGAILNPIMDGVNAALVMDNDMTNACTLGGLVHWARIGDIETDEGTLGEQAIARIPVEMFVPG
jgi:hypothetical protein